jgi:hypothetical protein
MLKNIFGNTNFYNLSDPQATWLFDVAFYSVKNNTNNIKFIEWCNKNIIITAVSLPSYHTEIVTKKFFGSEKSFPVIRTYGGECTMKFDVRTEIADMLPFDRLTQIDSLYHKSGEDYIKYHPELASVDGSVSFEKVIVRLKNKTVDARDAFANQAEYEFNNCIITDFGFNEELDYSSDSKLTGKLSFHYDIWHKTAGTKEPSINKKKSKE